MGGGGNIHWDNNMILPFFSLFIDRINPTLFIESE